MIIIKNTDSNKCNATDNICSSCKRGMSNIESFPENNVPENLNEGPPLCVCDRVEEHDDKYWFSYKIIFRIPVMVFPTCESRNVMLFLDSSVVEYIESRAINLAGTFKLMVEGLD